MKSDPKKPSTLHAVNDGTQYISGHDLHNVPRAVEGYQGVVHGVTNPKD